MCFIIPNALPMYVTQFSRVQWASGFIVYVQSQIQALQYITTYFL